MMVSTAPPRNPAAAPPRTPMMSESSVARIPTYSDTRAP
jgi:hypothetical protein